jgi:signal transduction histidine kinase
VLLVWKKLKLHVAGSISVTERQLQQHKIAKILYFRDISAKSEIDQMKSLFLSTAAHELRTPMASVFGFFELLLSREFDAQTTREILTTIPNSLKVS